MPDSKAPNIIDGFSSVQAVKHSSKAKDFKARASRSTLPALEKKSEERQAPDVKLASRISRSTLPEKFEIICYECEYSFTVQGKIGDTICPKCHNKLSSVNLQIDGEWTKSVKTIGTIEIKPSGIVKNAELTARNIVLAGNTDDGIIRAYNVLELCAGARFNVLKTRLRNLVIREDCNIKFENDIICNNLTVMGEINANVECSGIATIATGGMLKGRIVGPHLVVNEGGGLKARLNVGTRRNE